MTVTKDHAKKYRGRLVTCCTFSSPSSSPNWLLTFMKSAVHEPVTGEVPPAVSHSWFCLVSVGTLMPSFPCPFSCPFPLALSPNGIFPSLPVFSSPRTPPLWVMVFVEAAVHESDTGDVQIGRAHV